MRIRAARIAAALGGVAMVTWTASRLIPSNPTTVGFTYLLLVLIVASTLGFFEALLTSLTATLAFNFYFLPPFGQLAIADPQNWVALFSFLATALIASRLSTEARRRTQDALDRRKDVEDLYSFSRAILLIDDTEPFPKQLIQKLADIFEVNAAVLYERRTGELYRAGPSEFDGLDEQLRDAAMHGAAFYDPERKRVITAIRLGTEPIAALALQGKQMPDSVVQGIGNLVAIGLERAKSADLTHEVEAARRSGQLRTALIDAMAHEFKTPLTSIRAATSSLLATPDQPEQCRTELMTVADEEAAHLTQLIDDAVEMARLDDARIDLRVDTCDLRELVHEVVAVMRIGIDNRAVEVALDDSPRLVALDRRLVSLALKQLLDNALKYSPLGSPVKIRVHGDDTDIVLEITNSGPGIPPTEQSRIFERFYRSPSVKQQIPGTGLGLSIARSIAQAHKGNLTVSSRPGETTFRMTLPAASPREGV